LASIDFAAEINSFSGIPDAPGKLTAQTARRAPTTAKMCLRLPPVSRFIEGRYSTLPAILRSESSRSSAPLMPSMTAEESGAVPSNAGTSRRTAAAISSGVNHGKLSKTTGEFPARPASATSKVMKASPARSRSLYATLDTSPLDRSFCAAASKSSTVNA
jgi:hypothetical protein